MITHNLLAKIKTDLKDVISKRSKKAIIGSLLNINDLLLSLHSSVPTDTLGRVVRENTSFAICHINGILNGLKLDIIVKKDLVIAINSCLDKLCLECQLDDTPNNNGCKFTMYPHASISCGNKIAILPLSIKGIAQIIDFPIIHTTTDPFFNQQILIVNTWMAHSRLGTLDHSIISDRVLTAFNKKRSADNKLSLVSNMAIVNPRNDELICFWVANKDKIDSIKLSDKCWNT